MRTVRLHLCSKPPRCKVSEKIMHAMHVPPEQLGGVCRSADGLLDRELVAALGVAASRSGDASGGLGFVPASQGKKAAQKAQADTWELQRVTASIARTSLSGQCISETPPCGLILWREHVSWAVVNLDRLY